MPSRREFLRDVAGASGLVFVGCGLENVAAQATKTPTTTKHAPVLIRGRRIRTVDIHAHCVVTQATGLLKRPVSPQPALHLEGQGLADRLRDMDAQGIDVAVGIIDVKSYYIETPADVAERVRLCIKHAPADRLSFAPDCGLSQTARWAARQKLANLVSGVAIVRKELGIA